MFWDYGWNTLEGKRFRKEASFQNENHKPVGKVPCRCGHLIIGVAWGAIESLSRRLNFNLFKMLRFILFIKVKENLVIKALVAWCKHTLNSVSSDPEEWNISLIEGSIRSVNLVLALCLSLLLLWGFEAPRVLILLCLRSWTTIESVYWKILISWWKDLHKVVPGGFDRFQGLPPHRHPRTQDRSVCKQVWELNWIWIFTQHHY